MCVDNIPERRGLLLIGIELLTLAVVIALVVGLKLDHLGGASFVLLLLALIIPLLEPLHLCLQEVWIFCGEPRHRRLITLMYVPLLEDAAGVPFRRAGRNVHRSANELRLHLGFDLQKVEPRTRSHESPGGDVVGVRGDGDLRRLEDADPVPLVVALQLEVVAARLVLLLGADLVPMVLLFGVRFGGGGRFDEG